jgi:hypothetical protein
MRGARAWKQAPSVRIAVEPNKTETVLTYKTSKPT